MSFGVHVNGSSDYHVENVRRFELESTTVEKS